MGYAKRENVPQKVKTAIEYLLTERADLQAAALHAQLSTRELRRYLTLPQVVRYARAQMAALEALCLSSPANLADVLRGDNQMARVHAVKTAETLRDSALDFEKRSVQRAPGLQIIVMPSLQQQPTPMQIDVVPASEGEPVPAAADIDAE
jgi:hypothetical protein